MLPRKQREHDKCLSVTAALTPEAGMEGLYTLLPE